MAEHLAPIDEQVKIPAAVKAAAAAAEAFYNNPPAENASPPVAEDAPAPVPPEIPSPAPEPTPAPAPEPTPTPAPAEPNWEHRYRSMEGRVRQLTEINNTLSTNLQQMSSTVNQPPPKVTPLVTEEERKAYGDDLLSVVERKALEAVQPHINKLTTENQQLRQRLERDEARDVYGVLDGEIPNWKDVNVHPDFLMWLNLPDIYSGNVRAGMLRAAFASGEAPRVLAFFRGFLDEHPEHRGQTPQTATAAQAPTRQAAVDLKSLAAPGKARPAPGNAPLTPEPTTVTNRDIDKFYADVRRNFYAGREDKKAAREAEIHEAVRNNRVRYIK